MSDDRDSNVVQLPSWGNGSGSMPEAPNIDGLFYTEPPEEPLAVPPESPEETTMELPPIPRPMNPEMALASEGFPAAPGIDDELGENSDGEYVQRRSLAERIGDWLEYRIAVGQAQMEGEAPYKEAEIARKVELLNAKTAREVGLLEQQNKLRQAKVQARTARAAAQGKGEAAGSKSGGGSSASGLGRDKGGRKPSSSGSGGSGKGPGGRGAGTNNSGGAGSRGKSNSSGGANSPKGARKGPDGLSGGRNGAGRGKDHSGGSRGRQRSPGGSHDFGGSGKGGSKGNGGGKDRKQGPKGSGPTSQLPRNRQERKGARQTARQQRRAADHAAALTDRSKDRDQARGNKQADHEERRRKKAERAKAKADRAQAKRAREETKQQEEEAKRQEGTESSGRTTLGQSVGEEAQRRWDRRRSHAGTKKATGAPTEGTKPPKSGPAGTAGPSGPNGSAKSKGGPSGGPDAGAGGMPKGGSASGSPPTADGPGWPGNREETAEWVGREGRNPHRPAPDDEYIPDAEVITRSLPPAPEPHTERPGTSRPAEQENNVRSVKAPTSKTSGLAAQHRTNVTFDEYLVDIANIALASGSDRDEAKAIATVTVKIADRLREMATDLGNDHNIDTRIIDLISNLADAAARMQQQAERCAENCEIAADAAGLAAVGVARTYREDLNAMDAGGVTHASAAAHH